jgi:hypothetical protein
VFTGIGNDVVLGSTGSVFGEDGDATLISQHSATMTGGSGKDIFGFLATPVMKDSLIGVISEPAHKILDFETGVDSIKFYISSNLESKGLMPSGNSDHITKTTDRDIEWMYFHAGATSKAMTVEMNRQSWSVNDIEFIAHTPITPELVSSKICRKFLNPHLVPTRSPITPYRVSVCWHELAMPPDLAPALAGHWATLQLPGRTQPSGPAGAGYVLANARQPSSRQKEKGGFYPAFCVPFARLGRRS